MQDIVIDVPKGKGEQAFRFFKKLLDVDKDAYTGSAGVKLPDGTRRVAVSVAGQGTVAVVRESAAAAGLPIRDDLTMGDVFKAAIAARGLPAQLNDEPQVRAFFS